MSGPLKFLGSTSAVVSIALLGACAKQESETELVACPPAQIAVPSDRIGHNSGDGELSFIATLKDLSSSCRLEDDDIEIDLAFVMQAERGPAFGDKPLELIYFLATVDPNRDIIDKQLLDLKLDFGPDQPVGAVREEVTLRLPASTEATGANYSLYLGFQLDQQPNR